MSRKILMAVDGSERGFEAVSIVGDFLKSHSDIEINHFPLRAGNAGFLPGELW